MQTYNYVPASTNRCPIASAAGLRASLVVINKQLHAAFRARAHTNSALPNSGVFVLDEPVDHPAARQTLGIFDEFFTYVLLSAEVMTAPSGALHTLLSALPFAIPHWLTLCCIGWCCKCVSAGELRAAYGASKEPWHECTLLMRGTAVNYRNSEHSDAFEY